ncbi:MAG TPA: YafY family protein [Ktedonobacterales bacterium]
MYHPTSRVLTVLEVLQSRPSITGPELAARLEMDVRTVRRYITHLQDVGIPIESNVGRYGGYRLRPGFKLPPLMFTEEEATAVMLGLLGTSWLEVGQSSVAVEGALAKVSRVLPQQAQERLSSLATHIQFFSAGQQSRPDVALLISLSQAIGRSQRVALDYRSRGDEVTHRAVEPYGVVGWRGHWYLVGYCCLRHDHRTFRIDRIQRAELLTESFERPEGFDCRAFMLQRYSGAAGGIPFEVEFAAPLAVARERIPTLYGELTVTPGGVALKGRHDDMDDLARYLTMLNLPFTVRSPQPLRDALRRLSARIAAVADASA